MPNPTPKTKRNPPRASVDDVFAAYVKLGIKPEQLAYNRREDVVFVKSVESPDITIHEQSEWQKPHGRGL